MQNRSFDSLFSKSLGKFTIIAALLVLLALSKNCGLIVAADETAAVRIVSGKALRQELQRRRSLSVSGQSLRNAAEDLTRTSGIAVCLDRRLDPSRIVEIATGYVTTEQALRSLVNVVPGAGMSAGDRYVFVGPEVAAARLRTLTELRKQDVQALRRRVDSEVFRKLVEVRKTELPRLSEPRQLLGSSASAAGVDVLNPEAIPHDLWAAVELPPMTFVEFATLVLNQFDLTFELSAEGTVKLVSVPAIVAVEKRHRVSTKIKSQVVERWKVDFPDLNIDWRGSTALVSATVETHERLAQSIRAGGKEKVGAAGLRSRLFTMKSPGASYESLIDRFRIGGVPVRIVGKDGAELAELLRQPVTFDLTKSPGPEFFDAVFAGLKAEVSVGEDEVVLTFP